MEQNAIMEILKLSGNLPVACEKVTDKLLELHDEIIENDPLSEDQADTILSLVRQIKVGRDALKNVNKLFRGMVLQEAEAKPGAEETTEIKSNERESG